MSSKKSSKDKKSVLQKKVTVSISEAGNKRYVNWLCSPGNKCVPVEGPIFTENVNWRIFRIMAEFVEGFEFLSKLKKEVTIFGSARAMPSSKYYKLAEKLGSLLGKKGYSVITGGGPGIMEAANKGTLDAGGVSIGLDIELPMGQRRNDFVNKAMGFHYFFTRKVMLSASAQAYIFFPGGGGTMDEMTEMLTLIQTMKIPRTVPMILIGKKFWQPLLDWMTNIMCEEYGFIAKEELAIMRLVDTAEEAMKIIEKTSEREFG
ncbi:MAG: TIGR00730 family Rossman fold protein [Patescibacteria group bacterium]